MNTLKLWIEGHWSDFQDNKILQDKLTEFILTISEEKLKNMLAHLVNKKVI